MHFNEFLCKWTVRERAEILFQERVIISDFIIDEHAQLTTSK